MQDIFNIGPYECYIGDINGIIWGNTRILKTSVICKKAYKHEEALEAAEYLCNALGAQKVEVYHTDLHRGQLNVYFVTIHDVDYDTIMKVREVACDGKS